MTKLNNARPQAQPAASHADQRDRAARLRDTAGRFTKSQDGASPAPVSDRQDAPDPALAAIQTHVAASAAFLEACNLADEAWRREQGLDTSEEAMASARAGWEAANHAEVMAWHAVAETRPTTFAGFAAKVRHLQKWGIENDAAEGAPSLESVLEAVAADAERLIQSQPSPGDRPATVEGSAPIDFKANDPGVPLRSAEEWAGISQHALGLCVADRLLRMEKPEMVSFVEGIVSETGKIEPLLDLMGLVRDTREAMEALADMARATEARLFIATSAVIVSPTSTEA
ncbi:hypothetical protein MKK55_28750 [Methylobacterium sp. J-059]|uniref:hypothetical protein n=1 Tax=Methylobacterium sp. J-059 TaxID=2836643 RepID=UPI001FBB1701|nr:hypothetical protein [Methylobacterium sp. J-059]MCJ2042906.1 hypothetical protein [Methylobacterium sp. J-059]